MDWEADDAASGATPRSLELLPGKGLPLPSLDFERLREYNQRQELRAQNALRSASPAPDYQRPVHKKPVLRLARLSRLDGNTKVRRQGKACKVKRRRHVVLCRPRGRGSAQSAHIT